MAILFILTAIPSLALTGITNGAHSPGRTYFALFAPSDISAQLTGATTEQLEKVDIPLGNMLFEGDNLTSAVYSYNGGQARLPMSFTRTSLDTLGLKIGTCNIDLMPVGYSSYTSVYSLNMYFPDFLYTDATQLYPGTELYRFSCGVLGSQAYNFAYSFTIDIPYVKTELYPYSETSVQTRSSVGVYSYTYTNTGMLVGDQSITIDKSVFHSALSEAIYEAMSRGSTYSQYQYNRQGDSDSAYIIRDFQINISGSSKSEDFSHYSIYFDYTYSLIENAFFIPRPLSTFRGGEASIVQTELGTSITDFLSSAVSWLDTPIFAEWFTIGGLILSIMALLGVIAVIKVFS